MREIDYTNYNKLLREFKNRFPQMDYFTMDEILKLMDMAFTLGFDEGKKDNVRHGMKKVVRSDGKEYESIRFAAKMNKVSHSNISRAIENKYKCAGYFWKIA